MKVTSQHFALKDLARLSRFLGDARQGIARSHYLHIGDLSWQLFHMLAAHKASDLIRLWHDEHGMLVGFVLAYPDFGMFDLQVHPNFRQMALELEMLDWAQAQITALNTHCSAFYTLVNEHDELRKTMLMAQNYEFMGDWLYLQRSLTSPLPESPLPIDFRLSDLTQVDFNSRANALGLVFGAEPRPQLYQQFMRAPGYDPALDIVTVDANGDVKSFAMCWVDPVSKDGQFEPVGTVPEFQQNGLGKATLIEGMRRMQERGMENVIVIVDAEEEAARHLYVSVGLTPRWKLHLYGKQLIGNQ